MKTYDWRKLKEFEQDDVLEMGNQYIDETLVWVSQNGKQTLVTELDESHLSNIINMLSRELPYSNKLFTLTWMHILKQELKYRKQENAVPKL